MNDYKKNGYKIFKNVVPVSVIDEIVQEALTLCNTRLASLGFSAEKKIFTALKSLHSTDIKSFVATRKTIQYLPVFNQLAVSEPILNTAQKVGIQMPVISTRPVFHSMCSDMEIPGGYNFTPPHQDWRNIQGSLNLAIFWVPLMDVDENFYPLEVVPGSHLEGLIPSHETIFGQVIQSEFLENKSFVKVPVKKGDVIAFSSFLVHRTSSDGPADNVRLAASFRFNDAREETFVRRNFPNPYIYQPQYELLDETLLQGNVVRDYFENLV